MLYQFDPMNLEQETVILLTTQLRHLRGYNAVTQREIADALCIDRSTYAYYELGETQPSLLTLVKLARLYDVTTDYLLGLQEHKFINVDSLTDQQINILNSLILEFSKE